jgi:hypothetical protein
MEKTCLYCSGRAGIDTVDAGGGDVQHYSKIDCAIHLKIQRDKLEVAMDSWKENARQCNVRAEEYQFALKDALTALREHVCVKAIQGDGMNRVDYYPVEEGDCKLCQVFERLKNKVSLQS